MFQFERQITEFEEFLSVLSRNLEQENEITTYRILKTVLLTLREIISKEESIKLMFYLPTYLKIVYVENWRFNRRKKSNKDLLSFIVLIKRNYKNTYHLDLIDTKELELASRVIFRTLNDYVKKREVNNLNNVLPECISNLFDNETTASC